MSLPQKMINMINKGMNKKLNIINNRTDHPNNNNTNNNNNSNNDSNDSMDDNDNNTENENDNEEGSSMNCEYENFGEQESEGSSSVRTITPTSTSELNEERISHNKK